MEYLGVAFGERWNTMGYAEEALTVVTFFVLVVRLLGTLVSLYTSLNERRQEAAILRALGAGPRKVIFLLVPESFLLILAGTMFGFAVVYGGAFLTQPIIERHFELFIPITAPTATAYVYLCTVILAGLLIGFVPAVKACRNALADGLSIRV
jgi:putative ABC transport system permease protein